MKNKICAVIVAAGSGKRMRAKENKVFLPLMGTAILMHTINVFQKCDMIDNIVLVTRECDIQLCEKLIKDYSISKIKCITAGGATRQESVCNGLSVTDEDTDIVVIHDGARALIENEHIISAIENALIYGAAAIGVKCKDTLKQIDKDGFIISTIDREFTYNIQTPQAFKRDLIINAHKFAIQSNFEATDDCALAEHFGTKVKVIDGSYDNIKITTPDDLSIAENILRQRRKI